MNEYSIVSLIGVAAAVLLALSGLRAFRVPGGRRLAGMALVWLALIVGLATVLHLTGFLPSSWQI